MDEQIVSGSYQTKISPDSSDLFVGREDLLDVIRSAVADSSNRYAIPLVGDGGVGKTAFLRKIAKEYESNEKVVILQIDYSHAAFQSLPALSQSLVQQCLRQGIIDWEDIQSFQDRSRTAEKAFQDGLEEIEVRSLEQGAYEFFINQLNQNLLRLNKRVLILSDTVEAAADIEQGVRINKIASMLVNTVIVVAGRPTPTVIDRYQQEYIEIFSPVGWIVHPMRNIDVFTIEEVSEYFALSLGSPLKPGLVETIAFLTERRPVLLALTVDWFKLNVQLPDEINMSIAELQSLDSARLKWLKNYFERTLIENIRSVRKPLDRIILYMSFSDRRYDKRILQVAMGDISIDEIERLEPELQKMAFIRSFLGQTSGLLHDEAKRLINQHAWPPYDPDGEERRSLARKVINDFYLPEIKKLSVSMAKAIGSDVVDQPVNYYAEAHLSFELEMECLGYHYKISLDNGRSYIKELIDRGISLSKLDGIYHEVRNISYDEAEMIKAWINTSQRHIEVDKQILDQALGQNDLSAWYQIAILTARSNIPTDPQEKFVFLHRALAIAEQANNQKEIAKIYNQMGLIYRRQGLWPQAEDAYKKTLNILKKVEDPDQKAATLNNWAYIKLLQGELDEAESLASVALEIRKVSGNQKGLAFSYFTIAEVMEAKGNLNQAMRAYNTAANLFKNLGLDQDHAQALIRLAEGKRRERNYKEAETLLKPGLTEAPRVRASAERELGKLYLFQARDEKDDDEKKRLMELAISNLVKSFETSQQKNDWYGQAQALYDLVFTNHILNHQLDESSANRLKELLSRQNYPIIQAQLDEVYAEAAYDQGEIKVAFQLYIKALTTLSTHNPRKYTSSFERFRQRLLSLQANDQSELLQYFDQVISEMAANNPLRSPLAKLCQAIKIAI